MRRCCLVLAFQLLLISGCPERAVVAAPPITLHPDNGHYFLWRQRPTVLITSGEHYGALLNLDSDFNRYLRALAADGLNHTRVFSGTYREVPGIFGITDNTLAPMPGRFVCPWARSDVRGNSDGGNRFDLSRWDDAYFDRLRRFMTAAQQQGVVVEYTLFCPLYDQHVWDASPMNSTNNVNGVGNWPRDEILSLKHREMVDLQVAFVRKVVRELNEFDNLYYEVCNEPYVCKLPDSWQHHIVDVIVAAERELPNRHLVSLNVANGRLKVKTPYPGVSIFNFHYCVPPDVVAMNYELNKVIGENETGFRGKHDFLYRSEAWDFLLAGGGLYNNLDYSFSAAHPTGDFLEFASPGGGSPELRKQLGILKRFMESVDFVRMSPNDKIIREVSGGMEVHVLAERGKAYAIYMHVALPNKPKQIEDYLREVSEATLVVDIPSGHYRTEWIDTYTGNVIASIGMTHSGGPKRLRSPRFLNDIALRIVAAPSSASSSK